MNEENFQTEEALESAEEAVQKKNAEVHYVNRQRFLEISYR